MPITKRFLRCSAATASIEYGLIAAALVLAVVTGATLIGTGLGRYYQIVQSAVGP